MLHESSLRLWPKVASRAAKPYLAGAGLSDALHTLRQLDRDGFAGSIGYWNRDDDSPSRVATLAFLTLDALAGQPTDSTLSIKANALGFNHSIVADILDSAKRHGIRAQFDSEEPETADRTLALIASGRDYQPDLGCTLPGRWRRSLDDAEAAIELGLGVRVVKGRWRGPDADAADPRTGFLDVIERLSGRATRVGVATHDAPLARKALALLHGSQTYCELEVLLGFDAAPAIREADAAGVPVRFYIPYGHAHLPYAVSRAGHDLRFLWWLLRDLVRGRIG